MISFEYSNIIVIVIHITASNSSACRTRCQNGGTCFKNRCFCMFGFQGPNCGIREYAQLTCVLWCMRFTMPLPGSRDGRLRIDGKLCTLTASGRLRSVFGS